MSLISDESTVITKTRDLCEAIAEHTEVKALLNKVETFFSNDEARTQYQSVGEKGEILHQKQSAGVELSSMEVEEFESARTALMENDVASDFVQARTELEGLQQIINRYVGMTLELGRVPNQEDFDAAADNQGCCGSGGAGGCGCD